jgi:hypothetical protein
MARYFFPREYYFRLTLTLSLMGERVGVRGPIYDLRALLDVGS